MTEARCRTCGRLFIPAPEHALKDNRGVYCNPTCFLHREDKKTEGKGRTARKVEQYTREGEHIKTYDSAKAASIVIGCDYKALARACKRRETYRGYLWRYIEKER